MVQGTERIASVDQDCQDDTLAPPGGCKAPDFAC